MKRLFALSLALVLALGMLPATVSASSGWVTSMPQVVYSVDVGEVGNGVHIGDYRTRYADIGESLKTPEEAEEELGLDVSVSTTSLDFGQRMSGTSEKFPDLTVTLTNNGSEDVYFSVANVAEDGYSWLFGLGSGSSDFGFTTDNGARICYYSSHSGDTPIQFICDDGTARTKLDSRYNSLILPAGSTMNVTFRNTYSDIGVREDTLYLLFSATKKVVSLGSNSAYKPDLACAVTSRAENQRNELKEQGFVVEDGVLTKYTGSDTEIVVPDGITKIGSTAFPPNTTSVTLPDSVTEIGSYAFSNRTRLTSVNIPSSVETIGRYAFGSCTSLTSISIPSSVKTIGFGAFSDCTKLADVELHDGLTSIGEEAFSSCKALKSLVIPGSVTELGKKIASSSLLESVVLSEGITTIPSAAFMNSSSLKSVTIPVSVTSIGDSAFSSANLVEVNYAGTQEQWNAIKIDEGNYSLLQVRPQGAAAETVKPVAETPQPVTETPKPVVDPNAPLQVVPTSQKLTVDGVEKKTEIYNINGSNYFKLRDVAALLTNTGCAFAVDYDQASNTVVVTTCENYTPIKGDLTMPSEADMQAKAATAVESKQSIMIDGVLVSDMSVYNLGGNNFFKLRDLGDKVGFAVDYSEATRTMLVYTAFG